MRPGAVLLVIFAFLLMSPAYAEGPGCSARFRGLLEAWVPKVQVPTWVPEKFRNPFKNYEALYYRIQREKLAPDSFDAQSGANDIAIRELQELGFDVEWIPIRQGLRITPEKLKKRHVSFSQKALEHPMLPEYLKELERIGGSLVIRPARNIARAPNVFTTGVYDSADKTITLTPHATWDTFIHEYQHAIWDALGMRNGNWNNPQVVKALRDRKAPMRFGLKPAEVSEETERLLKLQLSNLAINETIAVKAELGALYKQGYAPWSFPAYRIRSYAWGFQEQELENMVKHGVASPAQKRALKALRAKKILLHPNTLRPLVAAGAGAAYYYNEEAEELIVRAADGTLQLFKLAELESSVSSSE